MVTTHRAERVLGLAGSRHISYLSLSKALGALAALRSTGIGPETINHHVRAVKAFSRWLWRDGRAREHALAHLSTTNSDADRRRRRRALTPEEVARLIRETGRGAVLKGMTGPERSLCYALAIGSGLRSAELRTLTPGRFELDGDPPTVTVLACYAKNGKEAVQPLPPSLADRLRPGLAARPADRPVFDLTDRTAELIRADLVAAGIPARPPRG